MQLDPGFLPERMCVSIAGPAAELGSRLEDVQILLKPTLGSLSLAQAGHKDQPMAADDEDPPISDVDSECTHSVREDDLDEEVGKEILTAAQSGLNGKARNMKSLASLYQKPSAGPKRSRAEDNSLNADAAYLTIMSLLKDSQQHKRGACAAPLPAPVLAMPKAAPLDAPAAYQLITQLLRAQTDPTQVPGWQFSPSCSCHAAGDV